MVHRLGNSCHALREELVMVRRGLDGRHHSGPRRERIGAERIERKRMHRRSDRRVQRRRHTHRGDHRAATEVDWLVWLEQHVDTQAVVQPSHHRARLTEQLLSLIEDRAVAVGTQIVRPWMIHEYPHRVGAVVQHPHWVALLRRHKETLLLCLDTHRHTVDLEVNLLLSGTFPHRLWFGHGVA